MTIRETWRAAALANTPQFYVAPDGVSQVFSGWLIDRRMHCGLTILAPALKVPLYEEVNDWHPCPECGGTFWTLRLIAHLNDVHRWGWLELANKFPPILPEDQP